MSEEILDIWDESGQHMGAATRKQVHLEGLWHRTFHCWIYIRDDQGVQLMFQKRHPDKDTFPDQLDITSAGHLLAGELPEDGVRELEEELGLVVPFEHLQEIGIIEDSTVGPGIIDNELCHVYAYPCSQPLEQYRLQADEVIGLFRIPLNAVEKLFAGEVTSIDAIGFNLLPDGSKQRETLQVSASDFVPHEERYYQTVFAAVKRLCQL